MSLSYEAELRTLLSEHANPQALDLDGLERWFNYVRDNMPHTYSTEGIPLHGDKAFALLTELRAARKVVEAARALYEDYVRGGSDEFNRGPEDLREALTEHDALTHTP